MQLILLNKQMLVHCFYLVYVCVWEQKIPNETLQGLL